MVVPLLTRVALALALLTPLTATAQFRSDAESWITAPSGEITFDGIGDGTLVTDQYFDSDGVMFTNAVLNSTSSFFESAPYVRNIIGNQPWPPMTITWASAISSLAWLGNANSGDARVEAFLGGSPVAQQFFPISGTPQWFGFENVWLDAIRITAPTTTNGYLGLDNLQWYRAEADPVPNPPPAVPEPSALLLLGAGVTGLLVRRTRYRQS